MIKARDDGTTYGAYPATLTGVHIEGGTFTGNERGIRFGEPGKNNATPTDIQIHHAVITGNVQTYSGTDGSEYGGVVNHTQSEVDASLNYWGPDGPSGVGAGGGDAVSANVTFCPWLDAPDGEPDSDGSLVTNLSTGEAFCRIQLGIDDADTVSGHTLSAETGIYTENITITKGITLTGVSSLTTVVDGGGVANAVTVVTDHVTLLNFAVQGGYACDTDPFGACGSIVVDSGDDAVLLTGIRIAGNAVFSNTGNGIFVTRADGVVIEGNAFYENGGGENRAGISLNGGAWGTSDALVRHVTIQANDIYANMSYGVYAVYGVQDSVIADNEIYSNTKCGVQMIRFTDTEPMRDNTVRSNQIFDNARNGIKLPNAAHTWVLSNTVANNGWGASGAKYQYGLIIEGFRNGRATDTWVSGNDFINNQGGGMILLGSEPVTHTTVQYNTFISTSVAISNNVPYSVTASYNDWGVTDLAAIEDKIYHQVDKVALGEVHYYDISLVNDGNNPMADGASSATVTATLTGLLHPAGNIVSFTTDLGVLTAFTRPVDAEGAATTMITSTISGMATITGTTGMYGDHSMHDETQVMIVPLALDHFHFYLLQDQVAGVGFPVAISARDAADVIVTGFNGWATLTDTSATLMLAARVQFRNGVWNGVVTVTAAYADDIISATYVHDVSKQGASNPFDVNHNVATDVALSPAVTTITAGQSITYTVWATDSYGNRWDATTEALYAIAPEAGGAWSEHIYTAQYTGTWPLRAVVEGVAGTAALTVTRGAATALILSPPVYTLTAGDTVTYTVTAGDDYGNTWDATAAAVYTLPLTAGGAWHANIYDSRYIGHWPVTATMEGLLDTSVLHVMTATVANISLSPTMSVITAGQWVTYTVIATDTGGNTWDATSGTYFVIDHTAEGTWNDGVYTSQMAGDWAVTAVYGGVPATASLAVTHDVATALLLSPMSATGRAGQPMTYTVWAMDVFGNRWDATAEARYDHETGAGGFWTDNVYTSEVTGTWSIRAAVHDVHEVAALTVTAETEARFSITVDMAGEGAVDKAPNWPSYTYGEVVTLTAVPDPGWHFAGWVGDADCVDGQVTMDNHKTCVAVFAPTAYTLDVHVVGEGRVDKIPSQSTYTYGEVVTLTATPDPGWRFVEWQGDLESSDLSDVLLMDRAKVVTAVFTLEETCVNVNAVTLERLTTGDIYTDTLVQFQATVAPAAVVLYTYTLDFGMGASSPLQTTDNPLQFTHVFSSPGVVTVTIEVWNCALTVPVKEELQIDVQAPVVQASPFIYLPLICHSHP